MKIRCNRIQLMHDIYHSCASFCNAIFKGQWCRSIQGLLNTIGPEGKRWNDSPGKYFWFVKIFSSLPCSFTHQLWCMKFIARCSEGPLFFSAEKWPICYINAIKDLLWLLFLFWCITYMPIFFCVGSESSNPPIVWKNRHEVSWYVFVKQHSFIILFWYFKLFDSTQLQRSFLPGSNYLIRLPIDQRI